MTEQDHRSELLDTLLTTPHRKLEALRPVHQQMIEQDPRFYVRMAAWYADHGRVRDHREMFVVMLCLSGFEGHREVGLALLSALPPYQVGRVVDFVKRGLGRNVPRSMRTEVSRYLRRREASDAQFDRVAVTARSALKRLYAGLHIRPSERAQAVLFDDRPPAGSLAAAVKAVVKAETPAEQARIIADSRIPYRVAASVISQITPMVMAALIEVMSPQELINNIGSLKRRGAFDNKEIQALIEAKLQAARSDDRVSAYKAKVAARAAGVSAEVAGALDEVTEAQVKAAGRITRPTALLIDKSASMQEAIEVGRQLGALISAICQAELFAWAFDTAAYGIEPKGASLADWERALAGINAGGATSCGVALQYMLRKKQRVEQLVIVTDEDENTAPLFRNAYTEYAEAMGVRPAVILVKVGRATNTLERDCAQLGLAPSVFEFRGDYYALPNIVPMLAYPSLTELVMEVLDYPLPCRSTTC